MSGFVPVIILIVVLLIQALMRLAPNLFAIFEHSSIAKKSVHRADRLGLCYIIGTEIATTFILVFTFFVITLIFKNHTFLSKVFVWTMLGICVAEAITTFFFYFKRKSTRLFISRRLAKFLTTKTETAKSGASTFMLGFLVRLIELPFTFPLFILAAFTSIITESAIITTAITPDLTTTPVIPCHIVLIAYLVISILPFLAIYAYFHSGHTIADYQRFLAKNRNLTRIIISLSFLALSILMLILGLSL